MKNNKKIIIIVTAVVIVIAIAIGTVFIIKATQNTNNNTQNQSVTPTKETTDTLTMDAVKIINSDPAAAKLKLEQARKQYQDLNDANGVANVDSQLYLIEHPTPAVTPTAK